MTSVVAGGERLLQAVGPLSGCVHAKTLRFQAASEEREDPGLVLDDQDLHRAARATTNAG